MKYQHGVLSVSGAALWGSISISPISPRCEWHCQCHRWWWGGDCALWSITIWQFEERSHGFLRSGGKRRGGVNIYGERSSASQRRENLHGERSEGSKCRILSPSLWMFNPISSNYVQPLKRNTLSNSSRDLIFCLCEANDLLNTIPLQFSFILRSWLYLLYKMNEKLESRAHFLLY